MYTQTNEQIAGVADTELLYHNALELLQQLIATPSLSGQEHDTAALIRYFLNSKGVATTRLHNNIWAYNEYYDEAKPTILLNSHHDTVMPNEGYTRDAFKSEIIDGRLYGLGSNDAGGCLVSLMAVFLHFYHHEHLSYNLCFAATAEEESSGPNGLKAVLPHIGHIDFAIVGEPTQMHLATAEMGCMVLDCATHGIAGHAARNEGDNALYKALADVQWFSTYKFPKQAAFLGPVRMTVTELHAGIQHNIIPHECRFTVDVRLSDCYTVEEVLSTIRQHTHCGITPRPGILKPSNIDRTHPIVRAGVLLGRKTYVSPTSSDQGWLDVPSVKIGPGDSCRSHMPDEFIYIDEIREGIEIYIQLLETMLLCLVNNPEK
ncbi:M20 family metallo-hydrolase [Mucilaginibacter gynuensis]|uniref:M20 family metallo-hydrolase n=1 Tax=Mucilaginibacter gynuensis TaxID=1302236 RepID=A0ABP8FR79_9SPHI